MYNILLSGVDHKGNELTFDDLFGRVGDIPIFERRINPDSGETEFSPMVSNHKTKYTIPFTKQKFDEISKYFTDSVQFQAR